VRQPDLLNFRDPDGLGPSVLRHCDRTLAAPSSTDGTLRPVLDQSRISAAPPNQGADVPSSTWTDAVFFKVSDVSGLRLLLQDKDCETDGSL